jgi:hypothetical protein
MGYNINIDRMEVSFEDMGRAELLLSHATCRTCGGVKLLGLLSLLGF